MIGVPYSSDFKSDWFSLDGTIRERLTCRVATAEDYAAYQLAIVAARKANPDNPYAAFVEATAVATVPLVTEYEVDGHAVPDNWREELPKDWRYRGVLSAIGQILFRQADFVGGQGSDGGS